MRLLAATPFAATLTPLLLMFSPCHAATPCAAFVACPRLMRALAATHAAAMLCMLLRRRLIFHARHSHDTILLRVMRALLMLPLMPLITPAARRLH